MNPGADVLQSLNSSHRTEAWLNSGRILPSVYILADRPTYFYQYITRLSQTHIAPQRVHIIESLSQDIGTHNMIERKCFWLDSHFNKLIIGPLRLRVVYDKLEINKDANREHDNLYTYLYNLWTQEHRDQNKLKWPVRELRRSSKLNCNKRSG